jgi:RNA-directed DNA polymerase
MDVGKMQTKLARWSQDQSFEFDDIFNIVHDHAFLHRAWLNVKSNCGSTTPGVDGTTAEDYAEDLEENLKGLRQKLKSGSYSPQPVRRTYIPKGPDGVRPLGIPTVEDRIVQESLRLVLGPIYETDFSNYSFGFRPNRSCHDAIKWVSTQMAPASGAYKHWILDLDVKGYFDNVDHTELMYILQDRIKDQDVQDLIWNTLKAGFKEDGSVQVTGKGTPQGGVVSPLLANVYLNELDQWIKKWTDGERGGDENWSYARYADDFLIMTDGRKSEAEGMMDKVERFLAEELRLDLSPQKSSLTHAMEGTDFLGYHLLADSTLGCCKRMIPQEAKDYIRDRIKEATKGNADVSARRKIRTINAVVRGWANYYKYCWRAGSTYNDVEKLLWHRMMDWLAEKHDCSKGQLARRKLDTTDPISINDATLVDLSGVSAVRTESPMRHTHPYLDGDTASTPESQWGAKYLTGYPERVPDLANRERREGSEDVAHQARIRDRNVCQAQRCSEGGWDRNPLPAHHIRRRRSRDDDRLDNLVILCRDCHHRLHHTDEVVTVYHEGRDERIELS